MAGNSHQPARMNNPAREMNNIHIIRPMRLSPFGLRRNRKGANALSLQLGWRIRQSLQSAVMADRRRFCARVVCGFPKNNSLAGIHSEDIHFGIKLFDAFGVQMAEGRSGVSGDWSVYPFLGS